jgi:hypothetical protein
VAKDIPLGARGEAEETVALKHTLTAHHPELPPVYSTPDMIRLMETARRSTRCSLIAKATKSLWERQSTLNIARPVELERVSKPRRCWSLSTAAST